MTGPDNGASDAPRADRNADRPVESSNDGGAPSGAEYRRPPGVNDSFAARGPQPPSQSPLRIPPPGAAETFGAPFGSSAAFDPAPGERIAPRHARFEQPVHPALTDSFGPPADPSGDGFDAPTGTRIDPGYRAPTSPWWKEDAEQDPWRDPASPFWLGRAALFVDEHPIALDSDEPEPARVDDESQEPPTAERPVGRFGVRILSLMVLAALVAGVLGGGVGFWLSKHANNALHDPDIKLAKTSAPANRPAGSVAAIAQRVSPSVVEIEVTGTQESGTGSGVVIDKNGYILTNNHVVSAAASGGSIRVVFSDESIATASIVGRDTHTDLAVIKVDHSPLTVASLGDSSKVAVGDPVIAIGSPLGLQTTVTTGIVSALDRPVHVSGEGSDTDTVIDAIQTDAAINPGNSGGALVDASGAVIGIPSAIASLGATSATQSGSIGLGFAIPINEARTIATELIKSGKATHATLGASTRSVTDGTRYGAYILQIDPNGPAAKADLKEGDVIKMVDSTLIPGSDELAVAIGKHQPGQVVTLRVVRGSKEISVKVILGSDS
jgi:S1-C subfamily serine protease